MTSATAHPSAASPADRQADALVRAIEEQVAAQRRALLDTATQEAAQIRLRARDKARRQMRRAVAELRAVEREQRQRLQAELETAARRDAGRQAAAVLTRAWPALGQALDARWDDPEARREWVQALVAQGLARLAPVAWRVRHPAGWPADEAAALQAQLQAAGRPGPELLADAQLRAGLVIEAGGARLDGTPAALLADRPRAEAALLAALLPTTGGGA